MNRDEEVMEAFITGGIILVLVITFPLWCWGIPFMVAAFIYRRRKAAKEASE